MRRHLGAKKHKEFREVNHYTNSSLELVCDFDARIAQTQDQEAYAHNMRQAWDGDCMTIAIEAAKGLPVTNRFNVNTTELTYAC